MKRFISIDIETTGLDPSVCQVLEFAAVDWREGSTRTFHAYIKSSNKYYIGEPYALAMHQEIFKKIEKEGVSVKGFLDSFKDWIGEDTVTIAGKNFANFDLAFLKKLGWCNTINFYHRFIDVGNLYFDPVNDEHIPDLKTCLERAGINEAVSHNALSDAFQVCRLVEHKICTTSINPKANT